MVRTCSACGHSGRDHRTVACGSRQSGASPRILMLSDRGMRIVGDRPQEFGYLIETERTKWGEIIKNANIAVQ